MKEIKLTNGTLSLKYYRSNIDFFWDDNEETRHICDLSMDGMSEFDTSDNIKSFIDYHLSDCVELTEDDIDKLMYELQPYFYPHSSEILPEESYKELYGDSE